MPAWDNQVLAIEQDPRGRPGIKRYNVAEVEDELKAFASRAEERIRQMDSGKKPQKGGRRKPDPTPGSFQNPRKVK